MAEAKWTGRLARITLRLGIATIVVIAVGVTLARYDVVPKIWGLFAMAGGGLLAATGVVTGVAALILNAMHKAGVARAALIGLLLCGGFIGFALRFTQSAQGVPPIHDIATDLANPPAFRELSLRADNLAGVGTVEKWRELHAKAYGDIKPISLPCPANGIVAKAGALARERGWTIALLDPEGGRLEATAAVSFVRYYDDVIVQVTPDAEGKACRVDMRSVSRIGQSDIGVNAKRIREFLGALAKA
jgi:hypothetical protein